MRGYENLNMEKIRKYKTKQQEMVLSYLKQHSHCHVTADRIYENLKSDGQQVGKTTVYRCLDRLIEEGEVRKYIVEDGMSACFQYISSSHACKEHYHLKCCKCGELIHLSCDFLSKVAAHIYDEHQFVLDSSKTVFYGVCAKCQ